MNNNLKKRLTLPIFIATLTSATLVQAQNWPQPESAYMPSTQSPQWVENGKAMQQNNIPARPNMQPMPYGYQQPMPNYGYAPNTQPYSQPYSQPYARPYGQQPYASQPMPYGANNGWGNWPNRNNMMPSMPNMGNWSSPNMNMGNWSMPQMPEMNNMPGMPNMDNFSMPSPSFEMPSPSFNTPTMNMPFFN